MGSAEPSRTKKYSEILCSTIIVCAPFESKWKEKKIQRLSKSKEAIIAEELRNDEMRQMRSMSERANEIEIEKEWKKQKHRTRIKTHVHDGNEDVEEKTAENKVKSARKRKLHIRTHYTDKWIKMPKVPLAWDLASHLYCLRLSLASSYYISVALRFFVHSINLFCSIQIVPENQKSKFFSKRKKKTEQKTKTNKDHNSKMKQKNHNNKSKAKLFRHNGDGHHSD